MKRRTPPGTVWAMQGKNEDRHQRWPYIVLCFRSDDTVIVIDGRGNLRIQESDQLPWAEREC